MYILTISENKQEYQVSFQGTPTVQQVLEENGITMPHPCGGRGICAKCRIEITGNISEPGEKELAAGCRLSCKTRLYGDAKVILLADKNLSVEGSCQAIKTFAGADAKETCEKIGAAVDIGTTTVALSVFDLTTGKCLATETALNSQSTVAADVMGRIDAATKGELHNLQTMIVECIKTLAQETGYFEKTDKWVITGNTTMLYLLTGKNPKALATAPFQADYLFGEESLFLNRPLYLPDCMHAFVGADITCAVINSGMCEHAETALLCDIGTNGELALWKNGVLYTASTAAGPAFEGAGISCGCQSIAGAVERVFLQGNELKIKTIGDAPAVGLCGSGIIDAIACLLDRGDIEETGAMEEEEVTLCVGVWVSRQDVRAIQLAKSAIAAGIKTLLELTETKEEEISTLYLAGGFGSHLNLASAVRIGLLPEGLQTKVKVLGNAALKGAASMLTEPELKKQAHELASKAQCINLGGNPMFNENYMEEMLFPVKKQSDVMIKMAKELGFSHVGLFQTFDLNFRQEVRDMCAAGRCGSYGTRWTCPPHCGTLEESITKAKQFSSGILLQMTGQMEDDFDVDCMKETEATVKEKLATFVKQLKEQQIPCLPMSAGTCTKCKICTCPDAPCRFPEEAFISMEAYGLVVNDVCVAAGLGYNYGSKTITFSTSVLFN